MQNGSSGQSYSGSQISRIGYVLRAPISSFTGRKQRFLRRWYNWKRRDMKQRLRLSMMSWKDMSRSA